MTVPSGVWAFTGTAVVTASSTATPSVIPILVISRCNMVFLLVFITARRYGAL